MPQTPQTVLVSKALLDRAVEYTTEQGPSKWARSACSVCWGKGMHLMHLQDPKTGRKASGEQWCHCAKRAALRWAEREVRAHLAKGVASSLLGADGKPIVGV